MEFLVGQFLVDGRHQTVQVDFQLLRAHVRTFLRRNESFLVPTTPARFPTRPQVLVSGEQYEQAAKNEEKVDGARLDDRQHLQVEFETRRQTFRKRIQSLQKENKNKTKIEQFVCYVKQKRTVSVQSNGRIMLEKRSTLAMAPMLPSAMLI